MANPLFEQLLDVRGLGHPERRAAFLSPSYESLRHDPYLLPDMDRAVERLERAHKADELVCIYGDYDIDGLSATTVLLEAFRSFGFKVKAFIPNRFSDGYGLSSAAITTLAQDGVQLLVTVDCGSLSHDEIALAGELGVDVIVTDHHSVTETMPPAVAVINPKRPGHTYPFVDLAGCGVAFKLVQALQTRLQGLPDGQEKWLLDLVALGTVCDIVGLTDENRANVYWGLRVLAKTRRPGLKALAAVAGIDPMSVTARSLGYGIGPHLNAAGRLETAQLSLELLTVTDPARALAAAQQLHELNLTRRAEQDRIVAQAAEQAVQFASDPVLVLSDAAWSHGIIGIVAAKILEQFKKPTFILQEMGDESKGSARSFGDFSAVEAINAARLWLTKGGGHKLAAGVTLPTRQIPAFRQAVNDFYRSLGIHDQLRHLEPVADVAVNSFGPINLELLALLKKLEPYGHGNPEPIFKVQHVRILERREMGNARQHLKLHLSDNDGNYLTAVGFHKSQEITAQTGDYVDIWLRLAENEWRGSRSAEGKLIKVEPSVEIQDE